VVAVTVRLTDVVFDSDPEVPVTVTEVVPAAVVGDVGTVS
jgi:hypothetical protein